MQPQQQALVPVYAQQTPQTYAQPQSSYPVQPTALPVADRCPGCGSGNYGGADPNSRKRCYDCGYPITQSGSGMGKGITSGPQASGPVQPSKQVQPGGFNPQTIIGRLA